MTNIPYIQIGGGYSYAAMNVGLLVMNPDGKNIYVQPGDAEKTMRENIAALDEVSLDCEDPKRAIIADIALSEYFA